MLLSILIDIINSEDLVYISKYLIYKENLRNNYSN